MTDPKPPADKPLPPAPKPPPAPRKPGLRGAAGIPARNAKQKRMYHR
jgi:hypothetical protein